MYLGLCGTVYFNDGEDPIGQLPLHPGYSTGAEDPVDFLVKLYAGDLIQPGFGGMIQPNAWLTPRKIIDKAGFWNTSMSLDDDGEFFCRVVLASKGIRYSKTAINYYRKYSGSKSLSGKNTFEAYKNMLEGNKLKLGYILKHTESDTAKLALCRIFWENCFTFYPLQKELAIEASIIAKELDSSFKYNPYKGINFQLAQLTGWKTVKILQHLKHSLMLKLGLRK
ncbi:hypothetical protein GZH53_00460 [Flavihumibacter sp. R14]|nr:hypothetical protein [Flavihumibacter soli]